MTLTVGQLTYNGVTIGPSGIASLVTVDGLTGLPDIRNADVARPTAAGMLAGYDFAGARTITLVMELYAATGVTMQQNLNSLRAAFQPQQALGGGILATPQLVYNLGEADSSGNGTNRFVVCRPRKLAATVDTGFAAGAFTSGVATVTAQLVAVDPRIYDVTIQSSTVGLIVAAGGLTFPLTFPITFTTSSGNAVMTTNAGSTSSPPVITITGPCQNPRVENQTTGQQVQFNFTMASTDVLVLDCYAQTATLNGSVSRMNAFNPGSQWFLIPPGGATIGFYSSDSSATGATMQVQWSNAWA
jgi:hypothetical protein